MHFQLHVFLLRALSIRHFAQNRSRRRCDGQSTKWRWRKRCLFAELLLETTRQSQWERGGATDSQWEGGGAKDREYSHDCVGAASVNLLHLGPAVGDVSKIIVTKKSTVYHRDQLSSGLKQTRNVGQSQRDGRHAEHRWRPLFNAAKIGWRPLHAVQ